MREIKKCDWDYYLSMQDLRKITEEVYGVEFDIQMGEYPNGSYQTANTDPKYVWNDWPGDYVEDGEYKNHETVSEAIEYWLAQPKPEKSWHRPEWQPAVWAVLSDLADRGEIPHGHYFIDISW